ncbi:MULTISPECIES: hypothetical protein [unclassified Pseudomonas]|uniref:hypothetical protein n=1 Tax=unclassified Pseudomonas TaxID=196821 RepID=UPI0021604547|nr:hypothetical protein [Pseudomonas sp. B21-015]UVM48938.1 hypothetical protein LOY38_21590 [Pseudomonas sp. B21-015]
MSRIEQCARECRQCAGLFRLGRDVEAVLNMVEVFEHVQAVVQGAEPDIQQQWARLLAGMLDCQEAQDWLGLADSMEYELVDLLEAARASY